jgi:hypothetical protein
MDLRGGPGGTTMAKHTRTTLEGKLAQVWMRVLGLGKGGGHSRDQREGEGTEKEAKEEGGDDQRGG